MPTIAQPDRRLDAPVPLSVAVRDLLELSDLLDASLSLRLAAYREGFQAGHEQGFMRGYAAAVADLEASYHEMARRVITGEPFTELERRRWGPRGRDHFGDPRPDDYRGYETGVG